MIWTLFFSRLRPEAASSDAYGRHLAEILELAQQQPGFVSVKSFTAADGERLTVVGFKDLDTQLAWRRLPDHVIAQQRGREAYYQEYRLVVCQELRTREWTREADTVGADPAPN
jgi:heme-degrading monooxygenase HmoA